MEKALPKILEGAEGVRVRIPLIQFINRQAQRLIKITVKAVKKIKLVLREAVGRHHRGRRWTDRGYMLDTNPRKLPQLRFVEPARDACN